MQEEALTEEQKIKYANDVENAVTHLMDMIRKIGRPGSVMINLDGVARINLVNKRAVIDRVPGKINTVPRDNVCFPWKYIREFNGTIFYAVDIGGEE